MWLKIIALTIRTFVGKVMSLLFNTLSRFVIAFFPRSKCLSISFLSHHLQWFWSPRKKRKNLSLQFSSVQSLQSLSCVRLFATPWTAACKASLSITKIQEPTQIHVCWIGDAIQPSHLPLSPFPHHLQSFPASGSFQMSQFFTSDGQSIRDSASASVLPMNIQDWFPWGWAGWISLQSKGLSRVSSNTTVQRYQIIGTQLSL